jgi:flagellar biosynthesis protein FlhB
MPDVDRDARTEPATQRRREDEYKRGHVPRSTELTSTVTALACVLALYFGSGFMLKNLQQVITVPLASLDYPVIEDPAQLATFAWAGAWLMALVVAPVALAALVSGIASNLLQFGFVFSMEPLAPDINRVNPMEGMKRLFSTRMLAKLGGDIVRLLLISVIAYWAVKWQMGGGEEVLKESGAAGVMAYILKVAFRVSMWILIVLLFLAALDFAYQRWQFSADIRMTKEEVKREMREHEGDPTIRAHRRGLHRRLAMQRMMKKVPEADVVITNPTELAVALQYWKGGLKVPRVVAKGARLVAAHIRELAAQGHVPIVENKPLARELFKLCEPGDEVPAALYEAVAEVLGHVYRLNRMNPAA